MLSRVDLIMLLVVALNKEIPYLYKMLDNGIGLQITYTLCTLHYLKESEVLFVVIISLSLPPVSMIIISLHICLIMWGR